MSRATPEGRVKNDVKKLLEEYRKRGLWYYMPVQTGYGQQGIPDFIICFRGWFIAIECKAASGTLSTLQALQLDLIKGGGGIPLVVWPESINLVRAHLDMISTH